MVTLAHAAPVDAGRAAGHDFARAGAYVVGPRALGSG
jgi:hypothetical protein